MDSDLEKQHHSLVRALKVISLAALVIAIIYLVGTISIAAKIEKILSEMLPEGTQVSGAWVFGVCNLLRNSFLIVAPLAALALLALARYTWKTKAVRFLYLNIALAILLAGLGAAMRVSLQQSMGTLMEELPPPTVTASVFRAKPPGPSASIHPHRPHGYLVRGQPQGDQRTGVAEVVAHGAGKQVAMAGGIADRPGLGIDGRQ